MTNKPGRRPLSGFAQAIAFLVMLLGFSPWVSASGEITFSVSNTLARQADSTVRIRVDRVGGSAGFARVKYETVDGNGVAGTHYQPVTGQLTWTNRDASSRTLSVPLLPSAPYAGVKRFSIRLTIAGGFSTAGAITESFVSVRGSAEPMMGPIAASRLLTQGTFGPTLTTIDAASRQTYDQWFAQQAAIAPSYTRPAVATPNANWTGSWWTVSVTAPDQLRQRMAFALSEILVASNQSAGTAYLGQGMASYYDLLVRHSLGNYRTLLEAVTLSPVMGQYLNMYRNDKADPSVGRHADQNFAREIMQLFTIGLEQLALDGSPRLDSSGKTIPTYGYAEIEGLANALTGWASAPQGGHTGERAWLYARDDESPMVPYENHHDTNAKTLVGGVVIPAGGTARSDLAMALDTLFNHPNVAPFISRQLIQRLVTSNPSGAYVHRVATVFENNGHGVRGDLLAVAKAILTDREAVTPGNERQGKLREPLLRLTHLWRAFDARDGSGTVVDGAVLQDSTLFFGQTALSSPSVFNFFRPDYVRASSPALGNLKVPEFQITNETSLVVANNRLERQAYSFIDSTGQAYFTMQGYQETSGSPVRLRTAQWEPLAERPADLIDSLGLVFMQGVMPPAMRTTLINYVTAIPTTERAYRAYRAIEAAALIINAPQYVVQR